MILRRSKHVGVLVDCMCDFNTCAFLGII